MSQPPDPDLHGVRALVTGGTSGPGFAMDVRDEHSVATEFAAHPSP